jgi:hypothetical protein
VLVVIDIIAEAKRKHNHKMEAIREKLCRV